MSTDRAGLPGIELPSRRLDDLPGLQAEAGDVLRREPGGEPAAGSGGDSRGELGALARAAAVRFPDLRGLHGTARINAIADHITETAIARGELEELRLEAYTRLYAAETELAQIATGITKSKPAIVEARRRVRPDLAGEVDSARWVVERCTEQIHRMGGSEYDAASRLYTLASGA